MISPVSSLNAPWLFAGAACSSPSCPVRMSATWDDSACRVSAIASASFFCTMSGAGDATPSANRPGTANHSRSYIRLFMCPSHSHIGLHVAGPTRAQRHTRRLLRPRDLLRLPLRLHPRAIPLRSNQPKDRNGRSANQEFPANTARRGRRCGGGRASGVGSGIGDNWPGEGSCAGTKHCRIYDLRGE